MADESEQNLTKDDRTGQYSTGQDRTGQYGPQSNMWNSEIKMPYLMRFMLCVRHVCEHGEKCCAYLVGSCVVTVLC
jgi:hypothetical protein